MENLNSKGLLSGVANKLFRSSLILVFFIGIFYVSVYANDPPHNEASGVSCSDCHGQTLLNSQSPFYTDNTSDFAYNSLCMRCHDQGETVAYETGNVYHSAIAPKVVTHNPGGTAIKCTTCHHNHDQDQIYSGKNNKSAFFIATGTVTNVPASFNYNSGTNRTTITYVSLSATNGLDLSFLDKKTGDGRGAMLVPNHTSRKRWPIYLIKSIDTVAQTITVKGNVSSASNLGIFYGQSVRRSINYEPVAGMPKTVSFYGRTGSNAFTNGLGTGLCQICHTQTDHWRSDGSLAGVAPHSGMGNDTDCMACHSHTGGFEVTFTNHNGFINSNCSNLICHIGEPVIDVHKSNCEYCHLEYPSFSPLANNGQPLPGNLGTSVIVDGQQTTYETPISCDTCHNSHDSDGDHDHRVANPGCAGCHAIGTQADIDTLHDPSGNCAPCHGYSGPGPDPDPETVAAVITDGKNGTNQPCENCHVSGHDMAADHNNLSVKDGCGVCQM